MTRTSGRPSAVMSAMRMEDFIPGWNKRSGGPGPVEENPPPQLVAGRIQADQRVAVGLDLTRW